jgi:hypothetical protein
MIDEKKKAYKLFLQIKDPHQYIKYKKRRAEVTRLTRKIRRDDWDKFVKSLEHDITGTQRRGFKIFKKLQLETNDQIQTNPTQYHKRNGRSIILNYGIILELRKGMEMKTALRQL